MNAVQQIALPLGLIEPFLFGSALVFLRVAGVLLGLPVLANPSVPGAYRVLLLFWVSALVYVAIGMPPVPIALTPLESLPLFCGEFLVGAAMGFAARLLLAVAEIAGSLMGLSAGLGLAQAMDPVMGSSANDIGRLLTMMTLLLFVGVGGHIAVIGAVVDSYRRFPVGDPAALPRLFYNVVETGGAVFALSMRLAAPLAVVAVVVNAGLGLLVRVAPQLNLFAVGFLLVIGAGLLLLYHEVPAIAVELNSAMADLRVNLVSGTFAH